jgi:hypothetical protein
MIARSLTVLNGHVKAGSPVFQQVCQDILASETSRVGSKSNQTKVRELVKKFVKHYC